MNKELTKMSDLIKSDINCIVNRARVEDCWGADDEGTEELKAAAYFALASGVKVFCPVSLMHMMNLVQEAIDFLLKDHKASQKEVQECYSKIYSVIRKEVERLRIELALKVKTFKESN
jgi:hypothetical protein